jgi:guanine deaminase
MNQHEKFIKEAIEMAAENVKNGNGGPFGALIVKDGKVIGRGVNRVTSTNDPTAHAEVMAIRDACKNIDNFKLEGAVIYASCEPCPMCLSAVYWARISAIYFAANNTDASQAGFDDSLIYKEIPLPHEKRAIPIRRVHTETANKPFDVWVKMEQRVDY